jgi:hypothetical protein
MLAHHPRYGRRPLGAAPLHLRQFLFAGCDDAPQGAESFQQSAGEYGADTGQALKHE